MPQPDTADLVASAVALLHFDRELRDGHHPPEYREALKASDVSAAQDILTADAVLVFFQNGLKQQGTTPTPLKRAVKAINQLRHHRGFPERLLEEPLSHLEMKVNMQARQISRLQSQNTELERARAKHARRIDADAARDERAKQRRAGPTRESELQSRVAELQSRVAELEGVAKDLERVMEAKTEQYVKRGQRCDQTKALLRAAKSEMTALKTCRICMEEGCLGHGDNLRTHVWGTLPAKTHAGEWRPGRSR